MSGYLEGHILISTPALKGSCFEKAVAYVCQHDENGAIGVITNYTLGDLKCSNLLEQTNIDERSILIDPYVHFGGPVETTRGIIIHTSDYGNYDTKYLRDNVSITCSTQILKDIATGNGPKNSIITLGYSGWGAGQLEEEIISNNWLIIPYNEKILFNTPNQSKWDEAQKLLNIDMYKYSYQVGNA